MRRIFSLLLCFIMLFALLVSCDSKKDDDDDDDRKPINTNTESDSNSTTDSDGNSDTDTSTDTNDGGNTDADDTLNYNYDMTEYVQLPDYNNHDVVLELDVLQATIDSYIMNNAVEYTVKKGNDIYVDITVYEVDLIDMGDGRYADKKGNEILELKKENWLLEKVGTGTYAQRAEFSIIGTKIGEKTTMKITLPDGFENEEYRGVEVFMEITVKSKQCKAGDVVVVSYTGYYIDENGNRIIENGNEKTFDSSSDSKFYLGSHMAIEDFETNIIGMKIGETKSFKATFPNDYSHEGLRGQTVEFEVTAKGLYDAPIYNDEFIKYVISEYSTVAEFEGAMKEKYVLNNAFDYIEKNVTILKYPQREVAKKLEELKSIEEDFEKAYGTSLDYYLQVMHGLTREEYVKSTLKTEMIYYAIAQNESIEPTELQLSTKRVELIEQYKNDYMESEKLNESEAREKAIIFVDKLGAQRIYDEVLFDLVEDALVNAVNYTEKEKTHTSITEILAEQNRVG